MKRSAPINRFPETTFIIPRNSTQTLQLHACSLQARNRGRRCRRDRVFRRRGASDGGKPDEQSLSGGARLTRALRGSKVRAIFSRPCVHAHPFPLTHASPPRLSTQIPNLDVSALMGNATTHYGDPANGCESDEVRSRAKREENHRAGKCVHWWVAKARWEWRVAGADSAFFLPGGG